MTSYVVRLKYDPVWTALDWAKEHCPSYITNAKYKHPNDVWYGAPDPTVYIDYFFRDERDAFIFKLRWHE